MLIACPDCSREISDRAASCLQCGFPIAEHFAEQRAAKKAEAERRNRTALDRETDCPLCTGRGFEMSSWKDEAGQARQGFSWCDECNHSGHLPVFSSDAGHFAVALAHVDAFLAGTIDASSSHVFELGPDLPALPTLPKAGSTRTKKEDEGTTEGDAAASQDNGETSSSS